jgi:hypothetical protein
VPRLIAKALTGNYRSEHLFALEQALALYETLQYGPDLLLVNVATGEVVDVAYDVFY